LEEGRRRRRRRNMTFDVACIDGANERFDQFSKGGTSFFLPF
jgi:hypothetical protein